MKSNSEFAFIVFLSVYLFFWHTSINLQTIWYLFPPGGILLCYLLFHCLQHSLFYLSIYSRPSISCLFLVLSMFARKISRLPYPFFQVTNYRIINALYLMFFIQLSYFILFISINLYFFSYVYHTFYYFQFITLYTILSSFLFFVYVLIFPKISHQPNFSSSHLLYLSHQYLYWLFSRLFFTALIILYNGI